MKENVGKTTAFYELEAMKFSGLWTGVGKDVTDKTIGAQRPQISVSFYDAYALVPGGPASSSHDAAATARSK
jgi:hypothetical protein